MANTFLIGDTHFGHGNLLIKRPQDEHPARNFSSVEEMDELMVKNWNRVVSPKDKVYLLGDVSMARKAIATVGRCNGDKVLIKGNHDIFPLKDYLPHFRDIRGMHQLDKFVLTHAPIHPYSLTRWVGNIHGHIHDNQIEDDGRYFCVSVEQINYTPIAFEDVRKILYERI